MDFEASIDLLYGAIGDPASFDGAVKAMQSPLGASVLHVLVIDSATLAPVGGLCPATPEGHDLYLSRFARIDPRMGFASRDSFDAFDINAVFDEPEHRRSPVYHEFLDDFDAQSSEAVIKRLAGSNTLVLSSFRPASQGHFEHDLMTRFERFSRDIVRILNVKATYPVGPGGDDGRGGTLFVDRAGRVLGMTRTAERELRRPGSAMTLSRGRFRLAERESDRSLGRALDAVCARGARISGDILARDAAGRVRYVMTVQKAVGASVLDTILHGSDAMIRFRAVEAPLGISEGLAAAIFDLTPTEASTARLLCEGRSPQAIARARNVSLSTVRWTIRNLLDKVGASSQAELVARITRIPGMLG